MESLQRAQWLRLLVALGAAAFWTVTIDWFYRNGSKQLVDAEVWSQDQRMQAGRKANSDTNLVFIGITKIAYTVPEEDAAQSPALAALKGSFPWSRHVWAELVTKLADAGAKVIALDLVFGATTEADPELREVLDRYRNVVVVGSAFAGNIEEGGLTLTKPAPTVLVPDGQTSAEFDPRVGYINIWPDQDGVLRRHRYAIPDAEILTMNFPSPYHESFAARILRKMGKADSIPFDKSPQRFRFTAAPGFWKPIPIDSIFFASSWSNTFANGQFFKGKTIIVGPANNLLHDEQPTPFMSDSGQMLGPEIHLNALNAAAQGEFLSEPSPWESRLTIAISGCLSFVLAVLLPLAGRRLAASVLLGVTFFFCGQVVFDRWNYFLLTVPPLVVFGSASLSTFAYDFVVERLARLKLRATMEFYFSPKVLTVVIANPGSMEPREANVTLLLTDLRNSTPLAEKLGPQGMFKLLNRIFEAQTNAIMDEDGNLEHFLGDQFLSYWGAPQDQPDSADRALRAAHKLITAMETVKASLDPEVKALFGYGVALHHGPVLVGNKGSSKRLDYGLVGDTVNAAARIESLTKYYGVPLLVSGEFLTHLTLSAARRKVDVVIVKGKSHPVELYQLAETGETAAPAVWSEFENAFATYQAGEFETAAARFDALASAHNDQVSQVMGDRCRYLINKPPENWRGIWEMDRK